MSDMRIIMACFGRDWEVSPGLEQPVRYIVPSWGRGMLVDGKQNKQLCGQPVSVGKSKASEKASEKGAETYVWLCFIVLNFYCISIVLLPHILL